MPKGMNFVPLYACGCHTRFPGRRVPFWEITDVCTGRPTTVDADVNAYTLSPRLKMMRFYLYVPAGERRDIQRPHQSLFNIAHTYRHNGAIIDPDSGSLWETGCPLRAAP